MVAAASTQAVQIKIICRHCQMPIVWWSPGGNPPLVMHYQFIGIFWALQSTLFDTNKAAFYLNL